MGLEIPTGKDIRRLNRSVERGTDALEFIAEFLGAQPKVNFSIAFRGVITKGVTGMELREGQQVTATVALKTKAGHPATYQTGTGVWTSSDPAVSATVDPANELSAVIAGVDGSNNTAAVVTFKADADPDVNNSKDVVGTLDVVCTQGEAVVAEITTSAPVDTP